MSDNNPFAFISRLPDATLTAPFEKHPGVFISAALVEGKGRNVIIETLHGEAVREPVYTLNVGGRGSLVIGEQEFRDIVSAGLAMFEARQKGFDIEFPTPTSAAELPVLPSTLSGDA